MRRSAAAGTAARSARAPSSQYQARASSAPSRALRLRGAASRCYGQRSAVVGARVTRVRALAVRGPRHAHLFFESLSTSRDFLISISRRSSSSIIERHISAKSCASKKGRGSARNVGRRVPRSARASALFPTPCPWTAPATRLTNPPHRSRSLIPPWSPCLCVCCGLRMFVRHAASASASAYPHVRLATTISMWRPPLASPFSVYHPRSGGAAHHDAVRAPRCARRGDTRDHGARPGDRTYSAVLLIIELM